MRKFILWVTMLLLAGALTACAGNEDNQMPATESAGVEETQVLAETAASEETQAPVETAAPEETQAPTETTVAEETQPAENAVVEADMQGLAEMLGMKAEEAAACLGGGEENWTEDKKFFISHIFHFKLNGEEVKMHVTYDEQDVANSLSIWLTDGETAVEEAEVQGWVDYLKTYADSEPEYDDTSSEGGSKIWKWKLDDKFMKLYWNGDVVTVSINPAVGELK